MTVIHVAVGVIERDGQIFITRRLAHLHQGGKWEFPGGKVESGESVADALKRELHEELGIVCQNSIPLIIVCHDYGSKQVKLETHWVQDFSGEPKGMEGQEGRWVAIEELESYDFPEANQPILACVLAKG